MSESQPLPSAHSAVTGRISAPGAAPATPTPLPVDSGEDPGDVRAVAVGVGRAARPVVRELAVVAREELVPGRDVAGEVGMIALDAAVDHGHAHALTEVRVPRARVVDPRERPLLREVRVVGGRLVPLRDLDTDEVTVGGPVVGDGRCLVGRGDGGRRDPGSAVHELGGHERDAQALHQARDRTDELTGELAGAARRQDHTEVDRRGRRRRPVEGEEGALARTRPGRRWRWRARGEPEERAGDEHRERGTSLATQGHREHRTDSCRRSPSDSCSSTSRPPSPTTPSGGCSTGRSGSRGSGRSTTAGTSRCGVSALPASPRPVAASARGAPASGSRVSHCARSRSTWCTSGSCSVTRAAACCSGTVAGTRPALRSRSGSPAGAHRWSCG